jgi:hypothetical protein
LVITSWWCSIFRPIAPAPPFSWELFGPPRHQELIAHGEAQTFEDAKLAAERAFAKL